jgi:fumarate reductase subunit C
MTNRPYIRPMPPSWWMQQGRYVRYMIREATCVFIGLFAFVLIAGIYRLSQGREAFEGYLAALWSPMGLLMSLVILLMAVIHSITWFNLTPKAMPLWIGDKQAPGWIIIAAHYAGWFVVSIIVAVLAGGLL